MALRTELSGLPCKTPGCAGRCWVLQNPPKNKPLVDANGAFIQRTVICDECEQCYKSFERIEGEGWKGRLPERIRRAKKDISNRRNRPRLPGFENYSKTGANDSQSK